MCGDLTGANRIKLNDVRAHLEQVLNRRSSNRVDLAHDRRDRVESHSNEVRCSGDLASNVDQEVEDGLCDLPHPTGFFGNTKQSVRDFQEYRCKSNGQLLALQPSHLCEPYHRANRIMEHFNKAHILAGTERRPGPYPWRMSYISSLLSDGVRPDLACQQTGHHLKTMLDHYAQFIPKDDDAPSIERALRGLKRGLKKEGNQMCRKIIILRTAKMVGVRGFEPPAPTSRTWCSTKLSYTPMRLFQTPQALAAGLRSVEGAVLRLNLATTINRHFGTAH